MKQRFFSLKSVLRGEEASYVLVMAITIAGLLALVAFMVDSGNLFLAQLRLQRALDAGVIRALDMIANNNKDPGTVIAVAKQIAYDNLEQATPQFRTLDPNAITFKIDSSGGDHTTVTGSGLLTVPTLIMDALPHYTANSQQAVASSAIGENDSVAISLVLDVSLSMDDCIGEVGDDCDDNDRKIAALRDAVAGSGGILDILKPETDFVAVTIFSTNSTPYFSLDNRNRALYPQKNPAYTRTEAIGELKKKISTLSPQASTNIAGGLADGAKLLVDAATGNQNDPAVISRYARRAIILITDGAPTAGTHASCYSSSDRGYYLQAIKQSDSIRAQGITIHGIGIGPDPHGVDPSDEYQNLSDRSSVKSVLLRRVTNNSAGPSDPPFDDPRSSAPCVPGYDKLPSGGHGLYLKSPTIDQLKPMLLQIGYYIKNHLTK